MAMMKSIAIELEEAPTSLLQACLNDSIVWTGWLIWEHRNNPLVRGYIQEELSARDNAQYEDNREEY
jgi:hypothetical protein